jgi:hypothetical protein
MSPLWRFVHAGGSALFLLFAVVQLNDPDPVVWTLLYLSGTVTLGLAAAGRPYPRLAAGVAGVALMGALGLVGDLLWRGVGVSAPMAGPFGWLEEGLLAEERIREALGLCWLGSWCLLTLGHGRVAQEALD